jgi:hypothetical protein
MAKVPYRYYSVYERRTDKPVVIYGTAKECAKVMGVTMTTFYIYVTRTRKGFGKRKYDIYVDDSEEEEQNESNARW